jgi:hypothetical protein
MFSILNLVVDTVSKQTLGMTENITDDKFKKSTQDWIKANAELARAVNDCLDQYSQKVTRTWRA